MEQSKHDVTPVQYSVDCTTEVEAGVPMQAEPGQRNGDTSSSSPESGSLNGDAKRSGKSRRRRKRSAHPESCPAAVERKDQESGQLVQTHSPASSILLGLRSECASVWFNHRVYEQAESVYQCWLARSANGQTQPNGSLLPTEALPTPGLSVCLFPPAGGHVSVHKPSLDQAESSVAEEPQPASVPNTLSLSPVRPATPSTPDEGYLSLAPTPATPTQQTAPTAPAPSPPQPINGLPRVPAELLGDVWLEKPLYDRAEATFYQSLYGNNNLGSSHPRVSCPSSPSTCRGSDYHPQSLEEEEEDEEEEEEKQGLVLVAQGKAEVFHALHPIQEEEEPGDVAKEEALVGGACYFLHPDSERLWLDKWRYDAAEGRFHAARVVEGAGGQQDAGPSPALTCSKLLGDNTMSAAVDFLAQEKIWFDKPRFDEAERHFYERANGASHSAQELGANSILLDIARARENIQKSLAGLKTSLLPSRVSRQPLLNHQSLLSTGAGAGEQGELVSRIRGLEQENQSLHKVVEDLRLALSKLECRVEVLEKSPVRAPAPLLAAPCTNGTPVQAKKPSAPVEEEEDDIDLFGSDEEEDLEAERVREQRLKEYAEKKAKKPALIAKSSILLDVKPWDDETDMAKLEECVRSVAADGLLWGQSKLVPVGYGIKKLQISCVVEDDKVGTDMLEEEITKFEDYVQSVDVAAFNKI
ncbi:eukaryotic translation elongation factor 1 delta b (guanine nucleotide exchange protein) isoform X1 [Osmerus mordax]|uniref:eukaryotic translation elongation factor 1 delta b (guanine nucleotide exchange protein) isoform X1 n=2 Tax=Osmerus mordax TaxID=8014 RepID=UPI00350F93D6